MGAVQASTLIELYNEGVSSSLQLRADRSTYMADLEVEEQAFSRLLPELQLSANTRYSSQDQQLQERNLFMNVEHQKSASDSTEYELGLSQTLFDLPAYYSFKAGKTYSQQAVINLNKAVSDYTKKFLVAYIEVSQAREKLQFIMDTSSAYEQQASIINNRYAVGLVKISDVKDSESQKLKVQADEVIARNDLKVAFDRLSLITQTDIQEIAVHSGEIPVLHKAAQSISDLEEKYKNNYDFKLADLELKRVRQNWKATRSGHLPTIKSRLSYSKSSNDSTYNFQYSDKVDRQGWNVGVYLEVPLYSGGRTNSSVNEAQLVVKKARYLKQLTELEVKQEIVKTHNTIDATHRSILARAQAVEAVELALINAEDEYFNGVGPFSRVLDNRARLMSEKISLIQEKYEYIRLYILLKEVSGELSTGEVERFNRVLSGSFISREV
ncbi:type I secretion protein TolC [Pseudoalteromonas citrea]|uniref:Type I secretion protein TolC n=2 Tax=Pseudoalteromonas citrea TaxID=43655 RepID=A0A5S3XQJ9_9GAMM|nr:type I secretion protein TolC [Pseudoalteromonas citrea]TMP58581.1 type I secretion protein TolC [Pseudoalteromonas citrea]